MDDILNRKQIVNEEKFEQGMETHQASTQVVLDVMRRFGERNTDELALDFFFYTNERSKAESLTEVLRRFGYTVAINEDDKRELRFSITGQTFPLPNEDDVVLNWCRKMNELGYIHDCAFDGWGTPVTNGGWFSDDTPDEDVKKRLGFPPQDES